MRILQTFDFVNQMTFQYNPSGGFNIILAARYPSRDVTKKLDKNGFSEPFPFSVKVLCDIFWFVRLFYFSTSLYLNI